MAFASGTRARADARSGGTSIVAWPSYAASQLPSAWALEMAVNPDGCIRPSSINFVAISTFRLDHLVLRLRGVNFRRNVLSSPEASCPSTQPWQIASARATSYVRFVGLEVPFL